MGGRRPDSSVGLSVARLRIGDELAAVRFAIDGAGTKRAAGVVILLRGVDHIDHDAGLVENERALDQTVRRDETALPANSN